MTPRDLKVILRIQEEIRDLISKNAIIQINDFPSLCLSPIFVIPKKLGDLRVILNLKEFNLFILTQHFMMKTLNVILPQLSASDWAVSIDLKDAYLHIPVHPQSRRFLGFQFMDMTYQYKVLPFGLKDSPWVFTRVCGPSPPSRNSSLLLSGRLAPSGGVQGALGASSSDDPAMDPGSGYPCELEEVFPGTTDTSCLSRGAAGHPEFVGSSLGAQSTGSSVCDSGSHQRLVGFRPLVAEVSRPSRQLCGSSPQLQDADETSSASLPTVLLSLDRSPGQTCSFESRGQGFVHGVGFPLSSSRRETICPSSASSGDLHRRFGSRLGVVLNPHRVSGV